MEEGFSMEKGKVSGMDIKDQVTFTRDRINEICHLYHGSHWYTLEPNV
jgi:hypothetical protein